MFVKSSVILKSLFPGLTWEIKTSQKELFITFDDGPHPSITPWVLDTLDHYNAKSSFFCVGENVCRYPEIYNEIIKRGHSVGNHTHNHLNGWKVSNSEYYQNIKKAASNIESRLFRPPYGRISFSQIRKLRKEYSIFMWSILTYDFDSHISPERCFRNSVDQTKQGSIIVFHDSEKAKTNMEYALPKFLDYFSKKGYSFKKL